ncbi:MAG TPA: hypothetical protein VL992_08005 [Tepidisphaeraceae bacterium]|nr:hypothetical protein [Tepidisphaeraceae bacterium]
MANWKSIDWECVLYSGDQRIDLVNVFLVQESGKYFIGIFTWPGGKKPKGSCRMQMPNGAFIAIEIGKWGQKTCSFAADLAIWQGAGQAM